MDSNVIDIIELAVVFSVFLILLFIRYRYPHFSMHFLNGISVFTINSFDYESKCKKHSPEGIRKYKHRQLIYLKIMAIFSAISIIIFAFFKLK